MSERCRWVIEVRKDDLPLLEKALAEIENDVVGSQFDELVDGISTVECVRYEASDIDLRCLAEDYGLIFYGWHDEGIESNPMIFIALDGVHCYLDSNIERDKPVLEMRSDLSVDYDDLFFCFLYYEMKAQVDEYFGTEEFGP